MSRNLVSKRNVFSISLVLLALAAMTLPLMLRAARADDGGEQSRELHVKKNCSSYSGNAGDYCTIMSSNLAQIVGSRVYYTQAAVAATTYEGGDVFLDSNVVLFAGTLDRAFGRCTLDATGNYGLCTFSDGIGKFAGFSARVNVSPVSTSPTNVDYYWNGTYSFKSEPDRDR